MADYDVIVIGGGFAGATAAREVGKAGLRCLLLEARDRLGGRTWYSEFAGHPVEMGGTWIHWIQPHVWAEVTRYGLEITESAGAASGQNCAWITSGQRKTGSLEELRTMLEDGVARFCQDAERVLERPYDPLRSEGIAELDHLSVQDRLDQLGLPTEQRDVLAGLWSTCCSALCREGGLMTMLRWYALSNRSFSLMVDAVARYKLRNGTRSLIEAIVTDGKPEVRLSTPVARIEQDAEKVVVTTQGGESFSSRAAVMTVPLNVLADIEFSHPLSTGKQAASRERQASHGVKSWAFVRGTQKDFFGVAPDPSPLTWIQSEYEVSDGTLLVGFGPDANLLDVKNPQAVQQAVRQFLPKAEVLAADGHNWDADPYSRGTWPVFRPRQLTRYLKELQRTEGRLVFAGSETANGWNGFIDGAIETGLRAGREVAQLLDSSAPGRAGVIPNKR